MNPDGEVQELEQYAENPLAMPHGVECHASYYVRDGEWFLAVTTPVWLCAELKPGPYAPVRTITNEYGAQYGIVRICLGGKEDES